MPTTSNFGWTTPADTDLVKDGAAAIRTLGNGIDASLVDLKGGTTGQILSKNSNTDLDYTWINNDQGDITAVTAGTGLTGGGTTGAVTLTNDMATTITASGDIVVGTGNGTYDNLPIGTTGQVLTADTTVSPYKVKWAAPSAGALTLITPTSTANSGGTVTTSGGAVTYSLVNNVSLNGVFTSTYTSYLIVISELTSSNPTGHTFRLRVSGTDSTTGYDVAGFYVLYSSTTVNGIAQSNGTGWDVCGTTVNKTHGSVIHLQNPNIATETAVEIQNSRYDAGAYTAGTHTVDTAYDGFTLIGASNTISGVVRVYGLQN